MSQTDHPDLGDESPDTDHSHSAEEDTITAAVTIKSNNGPTNPEIPVTVGDFTHREVPNPNTTTWKRIWGDAEPKDYPHVRTVVTVTTASKPRYQWEVNRTHHLVRRATAPGIFTHGSTPDGTMEILDHKRLATNIPSFDGALQLARDYMNSASAIDPHIPPGLSKRLAKGYCEIRHPEHPLTNETVKPSAIVAERTSPTDEFPIESRLEAIEDVYETPITMADSFVEENDQTTNQETAGDNSLMDTFRWIESWESKGFDVEVRMPATHEIIVTHPNTDERFTIREHNIAGRGTVHILGATVNGQYVEQKTRSNYRDSFAVALRDLSRLMKAEIGNERFYNR